MSKESKIIFEGFFAFTIKLWALSCSFTRHPAKTVNPYSLSRRAMSCPKPVSQPDYKKYISLVHLQRTTNNNSPVTRTHFPSGDIFSPKVEIIFRRRYTVMCHVRHRITNTSPTQLRRLVITGDVREK